MRIVFCAAEASPYAKVGGLGDVVGSLPRALAELDEKVIVCLPLYGCISTEEFDLYDTGVSFTITHEGESYPISVLENHLPENAGKVYFFANEALYRRPMEVYPQGDPAFESLRYEVFGKAIFQFLEQQGWQPDILHLHDWHTANMAVNLKAHYKKNPFFSHTGSVLTIHNMAYQGIVKGYNWLKEGLLASDALVAVSPTYAQEILTAKGGAGLEAVVESQQDKLYGILNGIDADLFNPATDVFIPKQYTVNTVEEGKAVCKAALQHEMGFEQNPELPLFGLVSRLVEQKGMDILLEALPELAELPAQFAFVGTGEAAYETRLREFNKTTSNIRSIIGFNVSLGQHVYAGADLFLMPSHFEPCGLGQMIALRYGTAPLVRKTGGLADTVFDIEEQPVTGNGFVFEDYTAQALLEAIKRAIAFWQTAGTEWQAMIKRGMDRDMSWDLSAREYRQVYQTVYQLSMQRI